MGFFKNMPDAVSVEETPKEVKYLGKHLEPPVEKSKTPPRAVLYEPIGQMTYDQQEGQSVIIRNRLSLSVSYHQPDLDLIGAEVSEVEYHTHSQGFKVLDNLVLTDVTTGSAFKLPDLLPKGFTVLFNPIPWR